MPWSYITGLQTSGPSCSKLTTSLVNDSLNLHRVIRKYAEIFLWKNVSSFCSAKATHIFSAKNIRILYIKSAKTVIEMTLNKLVKLTTLWTTGPCAFVFHQCVEATLCVIQPIQIMVTVLKFHTAKFLTKWQYANSADPDKTYRFSGAVRSGFTKFAIPFSILAERME